MVSHMLVVLSRMSLISALSQVSVDTVVDDCLGTALAADLGGRPCTTCGSVLSVPITAGGQRRGGGRLGALAARVARC
jgi:hypothetical protein